MGGSHSREGLELSDSSDCSDEDEAEEQNSEEHVDVDDRSPKVSAKILDDVDSRLQTLKLKYPKNPSLSPQKPVNRPNVVKLYLHIGGNTPNAKWVVYEKLAHYKFVKKLDAAAESEEDDNNDDEGDLREGGGFWVLKVGKKEESTDCNGFV